MTRPLKVGEYRKVKTWDELLATEGAGLDSDGDIYGSKQTEYGVIAGGYTFNNNMEVYSGSVLKITDTWDGMGGRYKVSSASGHYWVAEFFTDDYYDENGNEVKMEEDMEEIKLSDLFKYIGKTDDRFINGDTYSLKRYDKGDSFSIQMIDLLGSKHTMRESYFREIFEIVKLDQWHNDIDPLDIIEAEATQTLDQISKLREIDLKQAEIDQLIEAQNKRIEEYEKGATE